ncbi:MFS transporter [Roseiflexus castenholzii]|jgi:DHA3 family macrolide efflux protein-like MFS transporter|uniref:Major facilitator superfamily MFS_1 n=1 Tax=Roseiflexus castenholzii (strain DSM 13941 / HLO8) TaxID=383372 RepID=A7NS06_ROSCS|nr:MFS transporter [Roseiflexus castenholzii]ABU60352.1 major facilitator superfamily MFS_1 [Roseiflexus castenholzii DSM 13941]
MFTIDRSQASWKYPFALIWIGQAFSLFGSGLAGFAIVWWLTATTGSATVLATATLATLLPGILIGPLAGALIDRWDRRAVIMVADLTGALGAAALAVLFWIDALAIWHVYLIMALRSLAGAFHWPAMQASISLMAPERHLARIGGLSQMLQGATNIAAPPLGALLIAIWPLHGLMLIDVVTALIAVAGVGLVRFPRPPRAAPAVADAPATGVVAEMRAGLRYISRWPGLMMVMGMAALINLLLTPAFSLLPILVTRHFHGEALHLAWMNAAEGAGIVLGGLIIGVWGGFRRRMNTVVFGLIGLGISILAIGAAPATAFLPALAAVAVVGAMSPVVNAPMMAIVQSVVAPEMQGRVFTALGSVSMAMTPLGLVIAGPVADAFGVQVWYLLGGCACLLMTLLVLGIPAVRDLEDRPRDSGRSAVVRSENVPS